MKNWFIDAKGMEFDQPIQLSGVPIKGHFSAKLSLVGTT